MPNPWTTWKPEGAPFPFASSMHDGETHLLTEAGHDPETGEVPESAADQTRLALRKIADRLEETGFTLDDVIAIYPRVTAAEHAPELDAVLAEGLPSPLPYAGALLIVALIDPRMKIELEVVAQRGARKI